jgi:hypothetical protein
LKEGRVAVKAEIRLALREGLRERDKTIVIFLAKTRLRLSERIELTGANREALVPAEQPRLTIIEEVLPCPPSLATVPDADLLAEPERRKVNALAVH